MNEVPIRPLLSWKVDFEPESGPYLISLFSDERDALAADLKISRTKALGDQLQWAVSLLRDIEDALAKPYLTKGGSLAWHMRLWRGGQALWVQSVLRDEDAAVLEDLAALRAAGKTEDDPEIEEVRQQHVWLVRLLRSVDMGLMHLVGPDEDPR